MSASVKVMSEGCRPLDNLFWTQTIPGYSFVFVLLWISILAFPRFPDNDLDASWRMVLSYALNHNIQFGKDFIFTYGPLGFLMSRTYAGSHFYSHIIWQSFSSAVCAWIIMRTARNLSPARTFFYYVYFLLLGTIYDDALQTIIIVLLGLDLIREAPKDSKILPLCITGFLATSSNIKFTNFLMAVIAVGCACCYDLACKRRHRALFVASAYGITFVGIWIALGQNPLNIPAYFFNSLEVSGGYTEAMAWNEEKRLFYCGLGALVALVAYSLLQYLTRLDKLKATFLLAIFGAGLYLQWKHGFVRADNHVIGFFIYSLLPVAAFPAWLEDAKGFQKSKSVLLLTAGVTSLLGLYFALPKTVIYSLSGLNDRIKNNVESLSGLRRLHAVYKERWGRDQASLSMPKTKEKVGDASIDVLGYEQGIALYNGFHYTPRPIFQSYLVYTSKLIMANVDFFKKETAPNYVLQRYQTIDNRFPSLDDARVLNVLFKDYSFVFVENGYVLWQRKSDSTREDSFAPKFRRAENIGFNQRVELRELQDSNVWLTVKYKPSYLGKIRALLYKSPSVMITVFAGNTILRRFRLVGPMAEDGFLVNPLIENQVDLLRFISGQSGKLVTAFSIDVAGSVGKFFQNTVEIRLYSLPSLPPSEVQIPDFQASDYGGIFRSFPASITSVLPTNRVKIGTVNALMVHAPSEMVFDVTSRSTAVSGRFGFVPGAYSNGGNTDGAEFSISWVSNGKRIALFKQYLDPVRNTRDRDLHSFTLDISSLGEGKLLLRTDPGPKQDAAWDWTAWIDIEIK
jgi:hypothetical protein